MSAVTAREHQWDWLRAFLMLLGIPYHAAMAYNARVLWDIQSPEKSEILTFLSGVLVTFRMPAFFIVAGYFAAMMLERRKPASWLRGRIIRLGIPFLTGLVLLAPIQIAVIDLETALTGAISMTTALDQVGEDLIHPGANWIMHLWFLPALLAYSGLLVLIMAGRRFGRLDHVIERTEAICRARPGLTLMLLILATAAWEMMIHLSHQDMLARPGALPYLLAHGIDPYLRYLPFFLIGAVLRASPDIRCALVWTKGYGLPAFGIAAAILAAALRGVEAGTWGITYDAFDGAAAILLSVVLIGIAKRFWNRPDPRIDRIVDASFSIYLLHHPIIYALAALFILAESPPVVEFFLICLATFALSYGIHRLIRRSPLALFLFNGVRPALNSGNTDRPDRRLPTLR
ncbi:glucans biosynthesis protein [Agrobacterium albertimagni AOL15]|uniref:Glucans biosynthesis protein n=1 Tax=Agrobacterium albertimagni AOL15 TaxID=1156935 RepID=K2PZW1_9HYPH|nr:acyltransferase family protein [Agrobacterium albertimagni]EKF56989.1 glucans biosynthesis protein [Agrobacterium albertimagni AOL15]